MVFEQHNLIVTSSPESITVRLDGQTVFVLPAGFAVSAEGGIDRDLFSPVYREEGDRCIWTSRSSNWEKKELTLSQDDTAIVLRARITGQGCPDRLSWFAESAKTCLGHEISRYLIPAGLGGAQSPPQWRNPMESAAVELGYMTPPLLAFPFEGRFPGCVAVGLAPQSEAYNLDHFRCNFADFKNGLFTTDFGGCTQVDGDFELPVLTLTSGDDPFAALAAHAEWLYDHGGCQRINREDIPRWWLGPFFCGWGEQGILANGTSGWALTDPEDCAGPAAMATQEVYEAMSARLDELGLKPSAIIIDDKWQKTYGELLPDPEKWPDMRAFVEAEHGKGRRVVLWVKAWDNEGLSAEECTHCLCTPYGVDPTSPKYRQRVADVMHRLLSADEGCFNCDGFKIDFANCMPLGENLSTHEKGVYGIELLKRLMTLFYTSAKAVKPDCLINNSCCHPYFSEVTDQCRLHDFPGELRCLWEVREFRAKLFKTALPGISVDTDDESSSSRSQTLDYLRRAPGLGAPDLYRLHGTDNLPLTDDNFRDIARIWNEYCTSIETETL